MKKIMTVIALVFLLIQVANSRISSLDAWKSIYTITKEMKDPVFKNKVYNVIDFGAKGDGVTKNTAAINEAIERCSIDGGGHVVISKGTYLTGAVHLKSNVDLHLEAGAVLKFSTDSKDYLPLVQTRWEGDDCFNYCPLIFADGQTNFALTGKGLLDGQGSVTNWWPWKGIVKMGFVKGSPSQLDPLCRPLLKKYNDTQVPVAMRQMGEGFYLRPQFINFIHCKNFKIEDVTITNSPFWVIHPLLSQNVIVRNVTVNSEGPNNDGCDPESCTNVLIENCIFNTGDDCIALKSGRDFDGRRANAPIENVLIKNCHMRKGHGGVSMGSEISGGCKNIFVENCEMSSPELDRAILIKTNNNRGGTTDGVYVRNVIVGEVRDAILSINTSYHVDTEGQGNFIPMIRNVYLSHVNSKKSTYALWLDGLKGQHTVSNIEVRNCIFSGVKKPNFFQYVDHVILNHVMIDGKLLNEQLP